MVGVVYDRNVSALWNEDNVSDVLRRRDRSGTPVPTGDPTAAVTCEAWMSAVSRAAAAALLCTITACASAPSHHERIAASERAAMMPLKSKYPDVVMGFDFHGTVADVSVDINQEIQMDDASEDAMRKQALALWRRAWLQTHHGHHALLTVRIIDFRGGVNWKASARV